ncbi:conserved oligomeric Golgi complex component [Balamuthia mandrillaris]
MAEEEHERDNSLYCLLSPLEDSGEPHTIYEDYLHSLSNMTLQKLRKEPEHHNKEAESIQKQMQELAYVNYTSFIDTSECLQCVHREFSLMNQRVTQVLDVLPNLTASCERFCKEAVLISSRRAVAQQTLDYHTQLLDLLEVPELMDTCVRSEFYDEALKLRLFTQTLLKKHSHVPIVVNLAKHIDEATQVMLFQLQKKLQSNVQLPTCLQIIGYLCQLSSFTGTELQIQCVLSFVHFSF